jgi:hypothetical protein
MSKRLSGIKMLINIVLSSLLKSGLVTGNKILPILGGDIGLKKAKPRAKSMLANVDSVDVT